MNLFKLENNKLVIEAKDLIFPELLAVWEKDKSKDKEIARQELTYIYLMGSWSSPYRNYSKDKKESSIINSHIKIKDWKADKIVLEGLKRLEDHQFQNSPALRFLKGSQRALDQLTEYYNTVNFTAKDDEGHLIYNPKDLTSNLEKAGKVLQSLNILVEKVEQEMSASNSRIRGGGKVGMFED